MSWPDIDTFIANQLVTATDMNEIKENLEFLLDSSPTRKQPSGMAHILPLVHHIGGHPRYGETLEHC